MSEKETCPVCGVRTSALYLTGKCPNGCPQGEDHEAGLPDPQNEPPTNTAGLWMPEHTNAPDPRPSPQDEGHEYPRREGDFIIIGPGCFAADDRSVLNWDGVNYVPQPDPQGEDHIECPICDKDLDHEGYCEVIEAFTHDQLPPAQGEDHEAGIEAMAELLFWAEPWAIKGYQPPRDMADARELAKRLEAAYLSRCPSPERER